MIHHSYETLGNIQDFIGEGSFHKTTIIQKMYSTIRPLEPLESDTYS